MTSRSRENHAGAHHACGTLRLACSFWLVAARAQLGFHREARGSFDRLTAALSEGHGVLAEKADAQEVIELIEAEGRTAVDLPGDITDEQWCRDLVAQAVDKLGGLDILVINGEVFGVTGGAGIA